MKIFRARTLLLFVLLAAFPLLCGCPSSQEPGYYVEQLGSEKEETQRRAVEELTRMQEKALPHIEPALGSESKTVRIGCLSVLAKVRRMQSLTLAGQLIDDPDKAVRLAAISTVSQLSQVWKEKSTQLLSEALDQTDQDCVRSAATGLKDMLYEEATEALRAAFQEGKGVKAVYAARYLYELEPSRETAAALLEGLLAGDEAVRTVAEGNVSELKDQIIEPLVEFADEHKDSESVQDVLTAVRDNLITELNKILDSKRAAVILDALGKVADDQSIAKLQTDMNDTRLESSWRVAAATGLGLAAQSERSGRSQKSEAIKALLEVVDEEGAEQRVRIGAAIALCRLRQPRGVSFLLERLDEFQETVSAEAKLSDSDRQSLTELRIRAQEALTASGDFVIPYLRGRIEKEDAGPIIVWAAAKTMGELQVAEAVPLLQQYLTAQKTPEIALNSDGALSEPVKLSDWQNPGDAEVAAFEGKLETFKHPGYVRWTAAIALGQIGGQEAVEALESAAQAEQGFLSRLRKSKELPNSYERGPVIDSLIRRHEDVLYYIRLALGGPAAAP